MAQILALVLRDLSIKKGFILAEEFKFDENRKWRFDYCIPAWKIGIEYEGQGGRHNSFIGYSKDCEKYNSATVQGWRVYRFTAWHFQKKNINATLDFLDGIARKGGK